MDTQKIKETLKHFVLLDEESLAVVAEFIALAEDETKKEITPVLVIQGECGVGKTHLAKAMLYISKKFAYVDEADVKDYWFKGAFASSDTPLVVCCHKLPGFLDKRRPVMIVHLKLHNLSEIKETGIPLTFDAAVKKYEKMMEV